ncbi:hypothetical protein K7472_02380 [Streptomyces sp. PTM05]|uniref:Uncharacterized protein n=1 Tax=Streptantibioticus parmotrematis TaxID=2873249 RepID=A0ABS7QKI8_9ACTN|nr:hypothetical protein [Streptantibioticus parmotrematis]MBY8883693.1 hypothetical protein [Streptantibioticus parmotrematis]
MVRILAEVVLVGVPPVCWAALARTRAVAVGVGVVLLVAAALLGSELSGLLPQRPRAESIVGYAPLVAVMIGVGVLAERRLRGRRPPSDRARSATVVLCGYLATVLLLFTPYYLFFGLRDARMPSTDLVLPLPTGYAVASDSGTGPQACGSEVCSRLLSVTGPQGQPAEATAAALREWLTARHGWRLDAAGSGTRRIGWLLDHRSTSVDVRVTGRRVWMELECGDDWH